MEKGKLIVISGPSGVGKGTIVNRVLKEDKSFTVSVSATTRKKREGELDGINYIFMTKNEFEDKIKNGEFAEFTKYAGNYYGTLVKTINENLNKGKNLILEIEVEGASQIKSCYPDAHLIFIKPPNLAELKRRLINRHTEDEETINLRLAQVDREMTKSDLFDVTIVNDNLDLAVLAIKEVIYNF